MHNKPPRRKRARLTVSANILERYLELSGRRTKKVGEFLGVSRNAINNWRRAGKMPRNAYQIVKQKYEEELRYQNEDSSELSGIGTASPVQEFEFKAEHYSSATPEPVNEKEEVSCEMGPAAKRSWDANEGMHPVPISMGNGKCFLVCVGERDDLSLLGMLAERLGVTIQEIPVWG